MKTLGIHVLTIPSRKDKFELLLSELNRQSTKEVEILVSDGPETQGYKRNRLLERSRSEYIVSVDDDDMVEPDYVNTLLECCCGFDVVTFETQLYVNGVKTSKIVYDAELKGVRKTNGVLFAPPTHICCWNRRVALKSSHAEDLSYGSDQCWWRPLAYIGGWSSVHIPRVLYHYRYSTRNDGASHDPVECRKAIEAMGPGGVRTVVVDGIAVDVKLG